jgi:hypothetical protein
MNTLLQRFRCAALASCLLFSSQAVAQKKPAAKGIPRIIFANPLGLTPGKTTHVSLRGLKLDTAKELRFAEPKIQVRILSKGRAKPVNQQPPAKVGDTQIEAEMTLNANIKCEAVSCVVVGPAGESPPHQLLINTLPAVADKEPNNGFADAQTVQLPQIIDGVIGQPQDVDVFRFTGKAGQRIVLEVQAARYGSALDSLLTLYDEAGRQLAANDDWNGSADSRLSLTLTRTGTYYVCLMDAQDQGGPAHVYRLILRPDR